MILLARRVAQFCAVSSFDQFGAQAETTPSNLRKITQDQAVTSFGVFPKLPLQIYAGTAADTPQSDWAEVQVSGVRNCKVPIYNNHLEAHPTLGVVNPPPSGVGENAARRVLPLPPPGGSARAPPWRPEDLHPTTAAGTAKHQPPSSSAPSSQPEKETTHGRPESCQRRCRRNPENATA